MSVYEPAMSMPLQLQGQDMNMAQMAQQAQPYVVAMLVPADLMTPANAQVVTNCSPANQSDTYVAYARNAGQEVQWPFQAPYSAMGQGSMENSSYSESYRLYDVGAPTAEINPVTDAWRNAESGRSRRPRGTGGKKPKAPGKVSSTGRRFEDNAAILDADESAKLRKQMEAGSHEEKVAAVAQILESAWPYSQHPLGCRLVQLAIEKSLPEVGKAIAEKLRGHVKEAAESPHANYVLTKVIEQLNPAASSFIAAELLPHVQRFARHRFGCRIVCRLVELGSSQDSVHQLIKELLIDPQEANNLCKHNFGHHVAQSILEHGRLEEKKIIADVLCCDLWEIAKSRSASYVLETALSYCSPEDQQRMVQFLVQPDIVVRWEPLNPVSELAKADFGVFVVRSLLKHPSVDVEVLVQTAPAVADVMSSESA